ncbi:septin-9 isoform X2 [Meles meles]|uniref:septin-9 isoform X2 n=1 Tax=Meles meles TaxID=9662 RepID=UPI001E69B905|nr:septin-9 isoform X2 [Meles meles]
MSDPAVNAQLDGIISDFEALKRSFEVEEAETPNSTPHRRVQTPVLRATVASSTQKFQDLGGKNSEPAARHVDSLSQRSPKAALRRVELSGPKAEPVSRRTEISIDISSKQVESAGAAGPSRFGLKRAEALGHKTPEPAPRRTEITIVKPQESAHRRMESPASKIPEVPAAPAVDVAPKRVEIQVPKPAEGPTSPLPPQTLENSEHALMSQLQSRLEPKPQPPVVEAPPRSQEENLGAKISSSPIASDTHSQHLLGVSRNSLHAPHQVLGYLKWRSSPELKQKRPRCGWRDGYAEGTLNLRKDVLTPATVCTSPEDVVLAPEAAPGCVGDMTDTPRDAGLKQAPAPRNEKAPADFGYVGIDSILEQMRRKAMKQGFEFNIMVVGQSGLGKSTLINTLFKSKISRKSVQPTSEERIPKTIEIKSITHDIEEKGVRMKLTVIDTPGFGDHINNENCWQPIMKFINDQYEKYLQEEVSIDRKKRIPDTRVHCCLYFIPATGHSLRPLDIEFMKRLSKVVNIVPVIAKADTLTLEERVYFKQRITADLLSNGIDVYPQKEFDEDPEDRLVNEKFREMIPFAVVGSDHEYQVNGKRILGRKTKWGTIEVENTTHCEFAYLRDLLIRTHMQNIKDITSSIHFEAYRVKRLHEGSNAMANGVEEKGPEAQEM